MVRIEPWVDEDLELLGRLMGDPRVTRYLGGPELAIDRARADDRYGCLHAFPNVENEASNAMCRKLGFELIEECDFEYPKGSPMRCNDWRLELSS